MDKTKKIKLIIGLFYTIFLGLFLFFFFSNFTLQEVASYDFIKENRNFFLELRQTNLFLLAISFIIFTIIWVLAAGFGAPIAIISGFIFGKWLGLLFVLIGMSVGATLLYIFANFFLKDFINKKFLEKYKNLEEKFKKSEFFYLKGIVDNVFERLGLRDIDTKPLSDSDYAEGVSYVKNDKVLVSIGLVGKAALKRFDIKQEVFYADLNWDVILESVSTQNVVFKEIPKFPEVTRDFALLLDESVSFQKVYDIAWSTEKKLLKKVNLFDVYTGDNLPDGKKSYAVSFTLMDEKKTLADKQIDKIMGKLLAQYQKELGAELRWLHLGGQDYTVNFVNHIILVQIEVGGSNPCRVAHGIREDNIITIHVGH